MKKLLSPNRKHSTQKRRGIILPSFLLPLLDFNLQALNDCKFISMSPRSTHDWAC
jgi:hypothetical protein